MAKGKSDPMRRGRPPFDIDEECETWDWARTAGVSAQDLRKALQDSFGSAEASGGGVKRAKRKPAEKSAGARA